MKYALSALALAVASATLAKAAPAGGPHILDANIVCQVQNLDQLWIAHLKDVNANNHPQAIADGLTASSSGPNGVHVNTIATEGLIGVDNNKVFYELYQDNPDLAQKFYVQQCNSTALNANQGTMNGDLPIKLISVDDPNLCASAIDINQGSQTSTPVHLSTCLSTDIDSQASQFWVQKAGSTYVQFLGNKQDGSSNYWSSETGGGNTYRTPNVMKNACADDDQGCKAGAIDWQLEWVSQP